MIYLNKLLPIVGIPLLVQTILCEARGYHHRNSSEVINKIVNGYPVKENEYPEFASIRINAGGLSYDCGGVFIATDVVLTAAHCLGYSGSIVTSVSAANTIWHPNKWWEKNVKSYDSKKACKSPFYKVLPNTNISVHDYGVVILKRPVPKVRPILPYPRELSTDISAIALGQGMLKYDPQSKPPVAVNSDRLMAVPEFIVKCPPNEFKHESRACMDSPAGNICHGDSGSPVVTEERIPKLLGISSAIATRTGSCKPGHTFMQIFVNIPNVWPKIMKLIGDCRFGRSRNWLDM